ncbi:unnamed protein product, partial [Laminaria digitata]
ILLGQVLSVLIATMSMSSASLNDRGVNLPCFVNFLNYGMITLIVSRYATPPPPWYHPWTWTVTRRYCLLLSSQVDVEGNTLAVLAFRYTSITSVTMLDAFSIPGESTAGFVLCVLVLRWRRFNPLGGGEGGQTALRKAKNRGKRVFSDDCVRVTLFFIRTLTL